MDYSKTKTQRATFTHAEYAKMVQLAKSEYPLSAESRGIIKRVNPLLVGFLDGTVGENSYEKKGRDTNSGDLGFLETELAIGAKIDWDAIRYRAYQKKLLGYELSIKEIQYAQQYMLDHKIDPKTIESIAQANTAEEDEAEKYSRMFAAMAEKTEEEIIQENYK